MNGVNLSSSLQEPLEKADFWAQVLQRGTVLEAPSDSGWTKTVTGTGTGSTGLGTLEIATGTTTASTAMYTAAAYLLDSGSGTVSRINWDKALRILFRFARITADANSTSFVQLKEVSTIGQLAAKGIGITVANLAVSGESYGTQRNTTSLSTTLTTAVSVLCEIRHYPGSRIEWYINGVLAGTESTAANIPSGNAAAGAQLVTSITNGAGTTSSTSDTGTIWIWQAL